MTRPTAIELANGISWRRQPGICRAHHQLLVNGVASDLWIISVSHPTALRPYYVVLPGGEILARKFSLLVDAKAAAIQAQVSHYLAPARKTDSIRSPRIRLK